MSEKFNVFDEWGNKVGEYTPAGGSGLDGLFMILAMVFLWTIGFLIYVLFRLIKQGLREVKAGNWNKAVGYWALPVCMVGGVVVSILWGGVSKQIEAREYQARLNEIDYVRKHQEESFTIERIGSGDVKECGAACWYSSFGIYKVRNNTSLTVWNMGEWCFVEGYQFDDNYKLAPRESWLVYCRELEFDKPSFSKMIFYSVWEPVFEYCIGECSE